MKALTYPVCLQVSQTPALEGAQCSSQEEILIRRDNWQIFSFYVCNVYMPGLAPDAALNLQRITSFHSKVGKVGRAEGRAPRRFVLTILNQQYNVTRPWAQKPLSAGCLHLSGAVGFHHHRRIISTSDDHLIPYWVTPPYVDLSYLSHPCRACLLGNVCHGVLPPLARPTLGRTQASPDAKPLLPFHLLPRFTDVSTVGHLCCHPNCALLPLFLQRKSKLKTPVAPFITLQVEEFVSWRKSACVELFSSTQMHERAAHTFPNISPLMQRAMTFSTQPGGQGGWGWWGADALVFLAHVSAPGACEGWRWRERAAAKCKPQKRVNVSGRAEGWRLVYAGTSWYAPWLCDVCTHSPCLSQCSIHDVAAPCSTKHFLTPLR